MKGSIDKRSDQTYRIRIHLGYDGGKRVTHTETFHGTKKDAEAKLRDLISEYERGSLAGRSKKSLNEFLKDWLETVKQRVKGRTHSDYCDLAKRYIETSIGKLPLDKLTPIVIQRLYNDLTDRGLSALTVKRLHTVLNQSLKQAVQWRMIAHNPAADVQMPRDKARKVLRALDLPQTLAFMEATRSHRLGAALRFAFETGCRPQEYCALTWSDIDFQTGRVQIDKAMTWPKGGGFLVETTKTKSSSRSLIVSPQCLADLQEHRRQLLQLRQFAGEKWTELDLVFPNTVGKPLNHSRTNEAFKALCLQAGIDPEKFSPYSARHTQATLLLQEGTQPKVASERLGHASITLTMDTYSHVLPGMKEEVSKTVGSLLHGLGHQRDTKDTKQTGS